MKRVWLSLCLLVFFLSGCAQAKSSIPTAAAQNKAYDEQAPKAMEAVPQAAAPIEENSITSSTAGNGGNESSVDQLIIQNASISIVVVDPATSMDEIIKMTENMKGFVVTSNIYKTRNDNGLELPEARITVRVPADKLTTAMEQIKNLTPNPDTDVLSENRTGQNVTKEYTDLQSRLKNLEDAEAQLREIMASATRTEDVMSVFNQLTQVREQIEVIKGQIKYYEESAAMSAIDITIQSKSSVAPLSIGGWQPGGVARNAIQALINALKFFAEAAIWIILFLLPVLIILFIPVWIIFMIIRAIVRKNKAKKEAQKVEEETKKTS
ncbi:DUF4349 domain-containing protein [Leptolinea tardivitalis]|uniref:DUF4349 domain-containing protein n=1 Tax=Leptolinea tardivitalis TaxID=229920 RepID=UPI000784462A|nr:DUF4349 domain-containing protein [Leptolinea tardivitalis]GAP21092.1 carbamate kinase [Leptolinea tardivitalis]